MLKDNILKYALQNAVKFDGKANPGAVIGKIIQENPDLKEVIKDIQKDVLAIVKEVNFMKPEEQLKKLQKLAPELLEEKKHEKREGLKEWKGAEIGKFVTRFAPSPSGPMHIGHAYVLGIISEYARMYDGKLILRIEDTNPENIDPIAYAQLPKDGNWLTNNRIDEVIIQSDRMHTYYKYAEELLKKGHAYICTCSSTEWHDLMIKMIPCHCRDLDPKEQLKRWEKMLDKHGYKEGEAVLRIKTNLHDKNPAMRDWPAARINESEHPRQGKKYRVWPLMNLAVVVDDIELGMTHIVRAKDHLDNAKRQEWIYKFFNKPIPDSLFTGRINFKDLEISCSKTKEKILAGEFTGWDDIRIPFLLAMRRRGYRPEAFIKYAVDVGATMNDKTFTKEDYFTAINNFNKEIIDPIANRYFFVEHPKEIFIKNAPKQSVELDLHPDNKKGGREFKVHEKFWISEEDYYNLNDGRLYRLMDCLNFKKKGDEFIFESLEYEKYKAKGEHIIHWLPVSDDLINVEVLMDNHSTRSGFGEHGLNKLKEGDIVQLERCCFCRLDKKEKDKLFFWFTHR